MITLPNYQFIEKVYESNKSLVYRGYRTADNLPVIFKILKGDYPSPLELNRYRQTYEIAQHLNSDAVVKVHALEKYLNTLVMVLEDFGGQPLKHPMITTIFPTKGVERVLKLLPLCIQIVESLEEIHNARVVHKDINPSNILYNPGTQELKITDFGISAFIPQGSIALKSSTKFEGTLAYIPPEQTGRTDSVIDQRADFYALGVTFYELFTQRLPFESNDPMELIHFHLARHPVSPSQIDPAIPDLVSEIVIKLLSKTAEARYQSAFGIKADLEICLNQLQTVGYIESFPLGQHDVSNKFQLPHKLYSRVQETEHLLEAFDRVCGSTSTHLKKTQREIVLVTGYMGVGKTSLVQEAYKPITCQYGYLIIGEFVSAQRATPYQAIIKALTHLVEQLLTENETQLNQWRTKLITKLGANASIIVDVIPEIELIIGKQPPAQELPSMESRNRFNFVFHNFINLFAQPEHPIILFLDNLQWIDKASLKLLQLIVTDIPYLLVIGAYRDNEINVTHPLCTMLRELKGVGVTVNNLSLHPLELFEVNQLIAETLTHSLETVRPLAELVFAKTHGNPFFVKEFLKSLYTDKLLYFQQRRWHWNLEEIQQLEITDNVVELLTKKIRNLSEKAQYALQLAACIGNHFALDLLATVAGKLPKEIKTFLQEAINAELILPINGGHWVVDSQFSIPRNHTLSTPSTQYMFVHERIHQIAYSLIPDKPKQAVHQQVGQLLLQNIPPEYHTDFIFNIVNQLNLGLELIEQQKKRDELARLNLLAGQKAKAAVAFDLAFDYLLTGLKLLGTDKWQRIYPLTLILMEEATEVAFLYTKFESMKSLTTEVLQQAHSLFDKIKIYEINIQAYKAQNRPGEAVTLGLSVLSKLGIKFPQTPTKIDILSASLRIKLLLAKKSIRHLSQLPAMTQRDKLAAMQIMLSISPAIYAINPKLLSLITFKRLELSIRYGNTLESIPTYASYGYLLCEKNIEKGYQFGQLALELLTQNDAEILKSRVFQIVYGVITHNKEHLNATLQPLEDAYQSGLDTGNFEYAAFSALTYLVHAYFLGKELNGLAEKIQEYTDVFLRIKQKNFIPTLQIYQQTVLNLLGQANTLIYLMGEAYDENQMLPIHKQNLENNLLFRVYFQKTILCYLFGAYPEALDNTALAEHYLKSVIGSLLVPCFYFYDSLVHLAVFPTRSTKLEKKTLLRKVLLNQKKLRKWIHCAHMNYLHKFYLVEAELARLFHRDCQARELYDKAIFQARKNEYLHEEALALELAAKFYLAKEQTRIAQVYLRDAHHAYTRWGATAKVKALEFEYPHLLVRWDKTISKQLSSTTSTSVLDDATNVLDLATVLKASQTLAGEIVLTQLLEKLMRIVIENVGAQKGFLLLKHGDNWLIEVKSVVGSDKIETLRISLTESKELPISVVQYVARTRDYLVLHDTEKPEKFSKDPYILKYRPKSILCLPLIYQGNLVSILYLENRLTTNVFTPTRLELLHSLSAQIAISIENARLYANLEEKVKERTKDLETKNRELMRLNEQLINLNNEKDEFLGIAAHDLKNPLAAIQGLSDLVISDFDGMAKPDILEIVKMISLGSRQMFELIKNLLDVNVIETGRLTLTMQTFNLLTILKYLVDQYRERARVKQIHLQFQPTQKEYFVFADEGILRQVLDNLISNAIKYSPKDTFVTVYIEQNSDYVRCAIKDEGPGLSDKDKQSLFKKFSRLTPQPTGDEHSTGLGLFIVNKLVKAMNGRVWCESELGQGSTFYVEFPVAEPDRLYK